MALAVCAQLSLAQATTLAVTYYDVIASFRENSYDANSSAPYDINSAGNN